MHVVEVKPHFHLIFLMQSNKLYSISLSREQGQDLDKCMMPREEMFKIHGTNFHCIFNVIYTLKFSIFME
jgi:hypothetical protein